MGFAKQAKRCPASVATLVDRLSVGAVVGTTCATQAMRSPTSVARSVDRPIVGAVIEAKIDLQLRGLWTRGPFLMVERLQATRVESGRASVVVVRPGRNGQGDRAGRLWAASHGDTASQYGQAGRHGEVDTARARRQGRHGQGDTARSTERARPVFQVSPQFSKFRKPFGFRQNGWAISL